VGADVDQRLAGFGELFDGVELPGEVVEPDATTDLRCSSGADPEQAEVVVVAGTREPQERRVRARLRAATTIPKTSL
jgi:hypothetical protein